MGEYLKKFNSHSEYETFKQSQQYIEPNVSVCVGEKDIHYNPMVVNAHEYVDLGLPSGTLWATENIKDTNGNELYFAWGETQGYTAEQVGTVKNFSWKDYELGTENNLSKYNSTDGKTILDSEDDAATANWGSDWKMPTKEQFEELTANTTMNWIQVDGVNGFLFTSTANTNTLFFPAVGIAENGLVNGVGNYGDYWSVSLNDDNDVIFAFELDFGDEYCGMVNVNRSCGSSVRPVHA